ncbi:MAG: hypothetical protein RJB11_2185 [Planctomycetota bacterium]
MADSQDTQHQPSRLFDIGSQVVVYPKGVVGIVVRIPNFDQPTYGIRFMDGSEEAFPGSELALLIRIRKNAC